MKRSLLLLLFCGGCMTAVKHGNIVEIDTTVFGMNVAASTGGTSTPAVQFGLIREKLLFLPTSTNRVYAPVFRTSGQINNNGRTLIFGGDDESSSGDSVAVTNK